jgi:zinc protease
MGFLTAMARSIRYAVLAASSVFLATAACAQTPAEAKPLWPHLASDISPDPTVTFGVLPNGLRYALMHNQLPPGAISIRLAFDVGSLHEAEDEKGLAHFIEHMAFNGSTNVPEGEMVRILERLGLSFGADTNAETTQTDTTYILELPNGHEALVDESLLLLREIASELTFDPAAIERERGVVLAEFRRGNTFMQRRQDQELDFLIPGSYAASRMPIGDPAAIALSSRQIFVDLYNRFYRPERAVLVIVGDVDVSAMEKKIVTRFGDWVGKGNPGAEPDLTYTLKPRQPEASVFTHPDGGDSISILSLSPFEDLPDNAANRRESNLLSFATGAVARRFAIISNGEAPPFRNAGLSYSDILQAADAAGASATVTPEDWKRGLEALEQEWRRALLYGFTKDEIDQQIAVLRTSQANAAERELTRTTGQLAAQLINSILDGSVFSTPSSGLKRFESWAASATPDSVLEVFRRRMTIGTPLFFMTSSVKRPGIEAEILEAWDASKAVEVSPPVKATTAKFAYTDFGKPGAVLNDERLADIDTRVVTFANNVHLNIKRTDFQKSVIQISLRVGGGTLDLPDQPFGLGSLMSAYAGGGLVKHSTDDLRAILSGHAVQTGFTASSTAFGATYSTTPKDLDLQMQVAAAYLTSPGWRPEAERRWRQSIVLSWPRFDANAQSVMASEGMRLLASGDKRFGSSPDDGVVNRSFTELRAYLEPLLVSGAIEIAIVGDVDEAQAIASVAKTFGALPQRDAASTVYTSDKPAVFRHERTPITLTHTGEPGQAMVSLYWPVNVDPDADPQAVRELAVLASVMRLKVTEVIREKLGASYSPSAGASVSSVYPGWGYLVVSSEVKPQDTDAVATAIGGIAASLRRGEVSEDEFLRAVTPSLEQLPRNASSNSYWLSLIAEAQSRPDRMGRAKLPAIEASLRAVSVKDIVAAANRWMTDAAVQRVTILPELKTD